MKTHPAADIFPLLEGDAYDSFKADVKANGLRFPIVLYEGKVLDGRNRLRACRDLGIEPKTVSPAIKDPVAFVVSANLARRHLDESQRAMCAARLVPMLAEEARERQREGGREKGGANLRQADGSRAPKSAERAAAMFNVSPRLVESAVAVLERGSAELVAAVDRGEVAVSAAANRRVLDDIPKSKQLDAVLDGRALVQRNDGDNEWYTPKEYIAAARAVMGNIDLDPASTKAANEIVKAEQFFTSEDNSLSKKWRGRVWMNPPYAGELIGKFAEKLAASVESEDAEQACVLVNNATETKWFARLASVASHICFPTGRVKFWHPKKEAFPLQGQAVLYAGKNGGGFEKAFAKFGLVCKVVR